LHVDSVLRADPAMLARARPSNPKGTVIAASAIANGPDRPVVLHVLPRLDSGGVERSTVDLALGLDREGWRAVVCSAGGRLERRLVGGGVEHVRMPAASKNPLTMAANVLRLRRLIALLRPTVVHAHSRAPAWSAAIAARRAGVPLVTTVHGLHEGAERKLKQRYNAVMTSGERVIAVSRHVADTIVERYATPKERVRTVHPGVDLREFDPRRVRGDRVARLAERWSVGFDRKIVMLPGRITKAKGHLLLLRALARLQRDDLLVLLVGPQRAGDGYGEQIASLLRSTGLGERVRFGGDCDDMPAAMMLADLVVLPATAPEAFGLVVAEAQAMGKPVVVTAMGGLPETVMPGATGWLVKPDDPEELAWAIDLALRMEPDVGARLAVRAREFVAGELGIERTWRRTAAVYEELRSAPRVG
jgi:glycosyltransferase involved in cell wall biosynthesis